MAKPKKKPANPWRQLVGLVWRAPLFALPFAVFFLIVSGAPLSTFLDYWLVSFVFAGCTTLAVWGTRWGVQPTLFRRFAGDPRLTWIASGAYLVASLLGTVVAALVLHYTLVPGMLGNARGVIQILTYSLLFGALFLALSLSINFYRRSIDRAGSERELQLARRIQRSFLLSEFPRRARIEVHAVNVSSKEVSGDFYDVVPVGDDGILLAIADVSGKGVPAAILSSMLQASLRTQAGSVASPAAMMTAINALACQRSTTGQFATFFLASVDERTLTLRFTNAGHNFPVLLRGSGERVLLETGGIVIGMMESLPWQEESLVLAPGDRVVLYTDGVSEAANAEGEMFGEERLYELLARAPRELTAAELVDRVLAGVREFLAGTEPGDDITVMALRVLEAPPAVHPGT